MVCCRLPLRAFLATLLFCCFYVCCTAITVMDAENERIRTIYARDDCTSNPNWQATQSAWSADDTDAQLTSWWHNVSSEPPRSFTHELGEQFGAHLNDFQCGIGAYSTCITPACADYQDRNDPAWSYLSLVSVTHLNTFFNALYTGVGNGQADYHALTNDMAQIFFPWKDPKFVFRDAAFWIVAALTALFAIPAGFVGEIAVEAAVAAVGVGAFVGAGVQEISQSLEPDVFSSQLTQSQGLAKLDLFAEQMGSASRTSVEMWANTTLSGGQDALNRTILDYLHDGVFASFDSIPSYSAIEQFYKAQLVARTIGHQWATQKIFVTFSRTDDPNDASGPNQTRYYSANDGGVYYLYRYTEDGILRGHLDKPWGLDHLNISAYGITGADISKASAGAYRVGGFNYSQTLSQQRIVASLSSNGSLNPFADGAGWEGTWTLPVCDIGTHSWNTQYGDKTSRYGKLPCCCGPNCSETAAFVKSANLLGFQTLLRGCKAQLAGSDISYDTVDYGFKWKKSLPLSWATWSRGRRAGIALGIIFAYLAITYIPCAVCLE